MYTKMSIQWLLTISCWGLVYSTPLPLTTTKTAEDKISTESISGLLKLLSLPESRGFVSLLPDKLLGSTTTSSATDLEIPLSLSDAETTLQQHKETSTVNGNEHLRQVRSITKSEKQVSEETTVVPVTEQVTTAPVIGETTASQTAEVSTTGVAWEKTTFPAETVNLDPETLENVSLTALRVLASVESDLKALKLSGNLIFLIDETSRPRLPEDIVENAKWCVKIQAGLRAMHELVQDFVMWSEGLTTVRRSLLSLDRQILKLISPYYEYTPTKAPGTDEPDIEKIITTLITLKTQTRKIVDVIPYLMSC